MNAFAAQRARMVEEQLVARGVRDPRVLAAMGEVPREAFVPEHERALAYADRALPLDRGQTVSQPLVVATMTEALAPRPGDRVLEIGTGSGYQTAVLATLVAEVFTVERLAPLQDDARRVLEEMAVDNVAFRAGDGTRGWPEHAPYDAILVTAAAPRVPEPLREQLTSDGGRLVLPVGSRDVQELVRIVRDGTTYRTEYLMGVRFVPLVGEEGWPEEPG